jgi:hypothetical protein
MNVKYEKLFLFWKTNATEYPYLTAWIVFHIQTTGRDWKPAKPAEEMPKGAYYIKI